MFIFLCKKFINDFPFHRIKDRIWWKGKTIAESTYDRWYNNNRMPIMVFFIICLEFDADMSLYWVSDNEDTLRVLNVEVKLPEPNMNFQLFAGALQFYGIKEDDLPKFGISKNKFCQMNKGDYSHIWTDDITVWSKYIPFYLGDFMYPGHGKGIMPIEKCSVLLYEESMRKCRNVKR